MRLSPARSLLARACAASLSACSSDNTDDAPQTTDPLPQEPQGAYTGPWTGLPERGEWTDSGALAGCSVRTGTSACGSADNFDLTGCDTNTLTAVERQDAIYRAELRYTGSAGATPGSAGFQFNAEGRPGLVMSMPASGFQLQPGTFLISGAQTRTDGVHEQVTFAGCSSPVPSKVTGCFVRCRNGQPQAQGTFRAERMTWREGEAESSGGLQLISESFVQRGTPVDIYVTRGHAYVVSLGSSPRPGGLTVFDVSDPAHPVQTASLDLPSDSRWNGVWAKDDGLYVASASTGVLVFDLSDPAHPAFVRRAPGDASLNVHTVFVEGDRLYAMSPSPNQETLIFDISSPLKPQLLSRYALSDGRGYPHDAFAYGGRLYINHTVDGFIIADVSGERPAALGRYDYNYSYSHASAVGTFNGRTVAFEGGETLGAHLRVLDVTDPAAIGKIGELSLRGVTSIHNMVLSGTRLYIAWYHEGVRVLDVSEPSQPRQLAHFNTFRETDNRSDGMYEGAIGMRVPGDGRVYVVDTSRGLLIFNEP